MMLRHLVALAALVLVVVALACGGGGSSGNVTYAPTVVAIKHIDFTGVELGVADVTNPPAQLVDQYPTIVATVNGQRVQNTALAFAQIVQELNRRQRLSQDDFHLLDPSELTADDPLDAAINSELRHQAVVRLNLIASAGEARDFAQTQEALTLHPTITPTNFAEVLEMLREEGFPEGDWAADQDLVEKYRFALADGKLRKDYCIPLHTPAAPSSLLSVSTVGTCDEFFARERKSAKIVYYVRWAD